MLSISVERVLIIGSAAIAGFVVGSRRHEEPSPIGKQQPEADSGEGKPDYERPEPPSGPAVGEGWNAEEREHRRKERAYWRITSFLALLAVIGATGTLSLSVYTLQEARRATAQARRQADAAETAARPLARIERLQIYHVANDGTRVALHLRGIVENRGSTSAQKVLMTAALFLYGAVDTTRYNLGSLCRSRRPLALADVAALPNVETSVIGVAENLTARLQKEFYRLDRPEYKSYAKGADVEVVGCLVYEDALGDPHRTSFDVVFHKIDLTVSGKEPTTIWGEKAVGALNYAD